MQFYIELSNEDIEKVYKRISANIKAIRQSKKISQEHSFIYGVYYSYFLH